MPHRQFVELNEYREARRELEAALDKLPDGVQSGQEVEDALNAYARFVRVSDHPFPMLLSVGEALTLPRAPSALYLLPPVAGLQGSRILVCQFRETPDSPSTLALYRWKLPVDGKGAEIVSLCRQDGPDDHVQEQPRDYYSLDERPQRIEPLSLTAAMLVFRLDYRDGSLTVAATPNGDRPHVSWQPADNNHLPRTERISAGNMAPGLLFRRRMDERDEWPDDEVLRPNGEPVKLQNIREIGRINGMDGLEKTTIRYLASNQGKVLRLDSASGNVVESRPLGGRLDDVVVLPLPDDRERPVILAPCYDGKVYWLEDEGGPRLEVKHWQNTERLHIRRIMGSHDREVLAMDQYQRLWPLQINDVEAHDNLRRRATSRLFETLQIVPDGELARHDDLARTRQLLLMNGWLHDMARGCDGAACVRLETLVDRFHADIKGEPGSESARSASESLYRLLRRLWRTWSNWGIAAGDERRTMVSQAGSTPPGILGMVIRLLDLPDEAPDWLWLKLFREWDLLGSWGRFEGLDQTKVFDDELSYLRQRIYEKCMEFTRYGQLLQQATTFATLYLPSQVRHIRALSSTVSQSRIVCVAHAQGLYVFDLLRIDGIPQFVAVARIHCYPSGPQGKRPDKPYCWLGQIGTVATEIIGHCGDPERDLIFIATQRGECRLLRLRGKDFELVAKADHIPLDCATARFAAFDTGEGPLRRGFLVAGSAPDEKAALGWIELDPQNKFKEYKCIYMGSKRGRIRMLARIEEPRSRDLWGIDQFSGELLHWSLDLLLARNPRTERQPHPDIWYRAASGLHTVYATRQPGIDQIVCAGHDGLAVALNRKSGYEGRLVWSAGCSATVRRLRRVCAPKKLQGGVFLLAGDSEHLLIYDDFGRLTGMLEEVGPVSALDVLKHGVILVGARSGRLMALSLDLDGLRDPDQRLPNVPNEYPLRRPLPMDLSDMDSTLDRLRADEPLLFQDGILRWWSEMDEKGDFPVDAELMCTVEHAIRLQRWDQARSVSPIPDTMVHRSALALRRPHSLFDGATDWVSCSHWLVGWLGTHWSALGERSPSDTVCQVVDAALFVLEPLANAGDEELQRLVRLWSDCIWIDQSASDPPLSGCPAPLYLPTRLRLMRLSQAMRAWQMVVADSPADSSSTPRWVDRLVRLWGARSADEHWRRLQWLMESRFPFSGELARDPWMGYLRAPDDITAMAMVGLDALMDWRAEAGWSEGEVDRLRNVFPLNTAWLEWINRLVALADRARDLRYTRPHHAGREENTLGKLREHLTVTARTKLTSSEKLALAALFWSRHEERWVQAIAARQNELHDLALQPEHRHYLDLETRYHWIDRRSVQVGIGLEFRGTRVLLAGRALDPTGQVVPSSPVETAVSADGGRHEYTLTLPASNDDELDIRIAIEFQDFRGIHFRLPVHLQDLRGLEGFCAEPWWPAQARRLMGWLEARTPILWLRGPDWPQAEHDRLESLVMQRYPEGWASVRRVRRLEEVGTGAEPFFVAGFAAGAGRELDATHALLHQENRGVADPWALAFWLDTRGEKAVREALHGMLPAPQAGASVGLRLLGETGWPALREQLRGLPPSAVVPWVCGGALAEGGASEGDLGLQVWAGLLGSALDSRHIANWLGVPVTRIYRMRELRDATLVLMVGVNAGERDPTAPVHPLANALWPNARIGLHRGVPFVDAPLELLHHRMERVYLLPLGIDPPAGLGAQDRGLWLAIGRPIPPGLPGTAIALEADAILTLLAMEDVDATRRRLNEVAGGQLNLVPERVFQAASGISEDRMEVAFHGRKRERKALLQLAQGQGEKAILLVGGRRTGKTTLLDRLRLDLKQEGKQRLWARCVFLSLPGYRDSERDTPLLRWFLNRLRDEFRLQGQKIEYSWSDTQKSKERDVALTTVQRRLAEMKARHGAPILLLDETSGLLRADAPHNHIGWLLREWKQNGLITVIATAYPHGSPAHPSLFKRTHEVRPDNPWHNFFSEDILELAPWTPRETWDFLEPRLAGFGIALPRAFEQAVLNLCRGVPWITQELGLALCRTHPRRRRQITQGDWSTVESQVEARVQDHISDVVRAIAEELDQESGIDSEKSPDAAFGRGGLWNALLDQASGVRLQPMSSTSDQWPAAHLLDLARFGDWLHGIPGARLADALVRLSEAGLLIGERDNARFRFWNDLMPALIAKRYPTQEKTA